MQHSCTFSHECTLTKVRGIAGNSRKSCSATAEQKQDPAAAQRTSIDYIKQQLAAAG
jgi:hypothetical protein